MRNLYPVVTNPAGSWTLPFFAPQIKDCFSIAPRHLHQNPIPVPAVLVGNHGSAFRFSELRWEHHPGDFRSWKNKLSFSVPWIWTIGHLCCDFLYWTGLYPRGCQGSLRDDDLSHLCLEIEHYIFVYLLTAHPAPWIHTLLLCFNILLLILD